jgi:hypothetical protein
MNEVMDRITVHQLPSQSLLSIDCGDGEDVDEDVGAPPLTNG